MSASPGRLGPDSDDISESEHESYYAAEERLRVLTESAARTEAEMARMEAEMARSRESVRARAVIRRAEMDTELARIVSQTQLRVAEFVAKGGSDRKRKKPGAEKDDSSPVRTDREKVMLLNLLQCDMIL